MLVLPADEIVESGQRHADEVETASLMLHSRRAHVRRPPRSFRSVVFHRDLANLGIARVL